MLRALSFTALSACTMLASPTPRPGTSADAVLAAGASANEIAKGSSESTVFGWHLEVTGDTARFYACDDETSCGTRLVELPAKDVTAMKVVGRSRPVRADQTLDGEIDVLRITVAHPMITSRGGAAYDTNRGLVVGGKAK